MSSAKNLQVSWKCEQYKALKLSAVQSNLSLSICILFAYTEPWSPKAKKKLFLGTVCSSCCNGHSRVAQAISEFFMKF